jgi:hypothetical protein
VKQSHAPVEKLIDRIHRIWQPRLGHYLSREDAREIVENLTGFFGLLAEWSRAEMPSPAIDTGKSAAANNEETHHER